MRRKKKLLGKLIAIMLAIGFFCHDILLSYGDLPKADSLLQVNSAFDSDPRNNETQDQMREELDRRMKGGRPRFSNPSSAIQQTAGFYQQVIACMYEIYPQEHPVSKYVVSIARPIVKKMFPKKMHKVFKFYIAHTDKINAFIYPDGNIVITDGLLRAIEFREELEFVLLHELWHYKRGHFKFLEKSGIIGAIGRARLKELEADIFTMIKAEEIDINPYGGIVFFRRLMDESYKPGKVSLVHGSLINRIIQLFYPSRFFDIESMSAVLNKIPDEVKEKLFSSSYIKNIYKTIFSPGDNQDYDERLRLIEELEEPKVIFMGIELVMARLREFKESARKLRDISPYAKQRLENENEIYQALMGRLKQYIKTISAKGPRKRKEAIFIESIIWSLCRGLNLKEEQEVGIGQEAAEAIETKDDIELLIRLLEKDIIGENDLIVISEPDDFAEFVAITALELGIFTKDSGFDIKGFCDFCIRFLDVLDKLYKKYNRSIEYNFIFKKLIDSAVLNIPPEEQKRFFSIVIPHIYKKLIETGDDFNEIYLHFKRFHYINLKTFILKIIPSIIDNPQYSELLQKIVLFSEIQEENEYAVRLYKDIFGVTKRKVKKDIMDAVFLKGNNKEETIKRIIFLGRMGFKIFELFGKGALEIEDAKDIFDVEDYFIIYMFTRDDLLFHVKKPSFKLPYGIEEESYFDPGKFVGNIEDFSELKKLLETIYRPQYRKRLEKRFGAQITFDPIKDDGIFSIVISIVVRDYFNKKLKEDRYSLNTFLAELREAASIMDKKTIPPYKYGDEAFIHFIRINEELINSALERYGLLDLDSPDKAEALLYLSLFMLDKSIAITLQENALRYLDEVWGYGKMVEFIESMEGKNIGAVKALKEVIENNVRTPEEIRRFQKKITGFLDTKPIESEDVMEKLGETVIFELLVNNYFRNKDSYRELLLALIDPAGDQERLRKLCLKSYVLTLLAFYAFQGVLDYYSTLSDKALRRHLGNDIKKCLNNLIEASEEYALASILKIGPQGIFRYLHNMDIATRYVILHELLVGKYGVLLQKEGPGWLISELFDNFIEEARDGAEQQRIQICREVLDTFARKAVRDNQYEMLYFMIFPYLIDRFLKSDGKGTDEGVYIRLLPEVIRETGIFEEYERIIKQGMKIGEKSYKLTDDLFRKGFIRTDISEKTDSINLILEMAQRLGVVGVRFLQLLGQYMDLPKDIEQEFLKVYDRVIGQSKFSAFSILEKECPEIARDILDMSPAIEGGSLRTTFILKMKDGRNLIAKILNPNAGFHTELSINLLEGLIECLYKRNPQMYGIARMLLPDLKRWIMEDIKSELFWERDREFNRDSLSLQNQDWAVKSSYKMAIPELVSCGPRHQIEAFIEGDNLTQWEKLEADGHDLKEITSLIINHFFGQIIDGNLAHSDIHWGNFRVTADRKVYILDRNYYLKLSEQDKEFLAKVMASQDADSLISEIIDYLLRCPENSGWDGTKELLKRDILAILGPASSSELLDINKVTDIILSLRRAGLKMPLQVTLMIKNLQSLNRISRKAGFQSVIEAYSYLHLKNTDGNPPRPHFGHSGRQFIAAQDAVKKERTGDGAIFQLGESGLAKKEFDENRAEGRYGHLSAYRQDLFRVAGNLGISLERAEIYGITSIVKGKKDFLYGYSERAEDGGLKELYLATDLMDALHDYDSRNETMLLAEYIEHELRCKGDNHQGLRKEQRRKYRGFGNYSDDPNDEGRLRDVIRGDIDSRVLSEERERISNLHAGHVKLIKELLDLAYFRRIRSIGQVEYPSGDKVSNVETSEIIKILDRADKEVTVVNEPLEILRGECIVFSRVKDPIRLQEINKRIEEVIKAERERAKKEVKDSPEMSELEAFNRFLEQMHWEDDGHGELLVGILNRLLEHFTRDAAVRADSPETILSSPIVEHYKRKAGVERYTFQPSAIRPDETSQKASSIIGKIKALEKERMAYQNEVNTIVLTEDERRFVETHLQRYRIPIQFLKKGIALENGEDTTLLGIIRAVYEKTRFLIVPNTETLRITLSDYAPDSTVIQLKELCKICKDLGDYILSIPQPIIDFIGSSLPILIEGTPEYKEGHLGMLKLWGVNIQNEESVDIGSSESIHFWYYMKGSRFGSYTIRGTFNHEFFGHLLVFTMIRKGMITEFLTEEDFKALLNLYYGFRYTPAGFLTEYSIMREVGVRNERMFFHVPIPSGSFLDRVKKDIFLATDRDAKNPFQIYHGSMRERIARDAEGGILLMRPYIVIKDREDRLRAYKIEKVEQDGTLRFAETPFEEYKRFMDGERKRDSEIMQRRSVEDLVRLYESKNVNMALVLSLYDRYKSGDIEVAERMIREMWNELGESSVSLPEIINFMDYIDSCGLSVFLRKEIARVKLEFKKEFAGYIRKLPKEEQKTLLHELIRNDYLEECIFNNSRGRHNLPPWRELRRLMRFSGYQGGETPGRRKGSKIAHQEYLRVPLVQYNDGTFGRKDLGEGYYCSVDNERDMAQVAGRLKEYVKTNNPAVELYINGQKVKAYIDTALRDLQITSEMLKSIIDGVMGRMESTYINKLPEEISICMLSTSTCLFENHVGDGFIGINGYFLNLYREISQSSELGPGYAVALLNLGLGHEFSHELTGKNREIEDDLIRLDAMKLLELLGPDAVSLWDFLVGRALLSINSNFSKYLWLEITRRYPAEARELVRCSLSNNYNRPVVFQKEQKNVVQKKVVFLPHVLYGLLHMSRIARKLDIEMPAKVYIKDGIAEEILYVDNENRIAVFTADRNKVDILNNPRYSSRTHDTLGWLVVMVREYLARGWDEGDEENFRSQLNEMRQCAEVYGIEISIYSVSKGTRYTIDASFFNRMIGSPIDRDFLQDIANIGFIGTKYFHATILDEYRDEYNRFKCLQDCVDRNEAEWMDIHRHPTDYPSPPSTIEPGGDIYAEGFFEGRLNGLILSDGEDDILFAMYETDRSKEPAYKGMSRKFWRKRKSILGDLQSVSMKPYAVELWGKDEVMKLIEKRARMLNLETGPGSNIELVGNILRGCVLDPSVVRELAEFITPLNIPFPRIGAGTLTGINEAIARVFGINVQSGSGIPDPIKILNLNRKLSELIGARSVVRRDGCIELVGEDGRCILDLDLLDPTVGGKIRFSSTIRPEGSVNNLGEYIYETDELIANSTARDLSIIPEVNKPLKGVLVQRIKDIFSINPNAIDLKIKDGIPQITFRFNDLDPGLKDWLESLNRLGLDDKDLRLVFLVEDLNKPVELSFSGERYFVDKRTFYKQLFREHTNIDLSNIRFFEGNHNIDKIHSGLVRVMKTENIVYIGNFTERERGLLKEMRLKYIDKNRNRCGLPQVLTWGLVLLGIENVYTDNGGLSKEVEELYRTFVGILFSNGLIVQTEVEATLNMLESGEFILPVIKASEILEKIRIRDLYIEVSV